MWLKCSGETATSNFGEKNDLLEIWATKISCDFTVSYTRELKDFFFVGVI